ncbi:hypothetical protein LCGC14_1956120 [marine sediment metagenome]|uniref:Uncharacterized protein n=1 Tax=marine sediment metagenome TaxID=412755 RepID=A0A0F9HUE2_9ZZZZ
MKNLGERVRTALEEALIDRHESEDHEALADEVEGVAKLLLQRAEEAFKSEVVDTQMWIEEAKSAGISGMTPEEFRKEWIEDWLAGDE